MKFKVMCIFTAILFCFSSGTIFAQPVNITIGTCGALTGSASAYGESVVEGAILAVEELNKKGLRGLNATFKLISKDDEQTEVITSEEFTSLVYDENCLAVIGTTDSGCTHVAARTALKSKTPLIATVATDPSLSRLGNPYLFRNLADDLIQGFKLVEHIVNVKGHRNICILHINTRYGKGGAKVVLDSSQRLNARITMVEKYDRDQKEFKALVEKVKRDRHDAMVIWGLYSEAAALVKELKAAGVNSPIFAPDGLATPAFIALAGDAANGVTVTWPFDSEMKATDPVVKSFVELYTREFGKEPDSFAAHAYDAVYLIAEAVVYGGPTREGVRRGLVFNKNFHGVSGVFSFDETGNSTLPVELAIIEKGKFNMIRN